MPLIKPSDGSRYDAFLSYSHAAQGELAPAVQKALSRLAKPWHRPRALRVFHDQVSLEAGPDLWAAIESKLAHSDYLILLASPQSARSPWVRKELAYWKQHCSAARLLIILADGELHWDHATGDFDPVRSTALPAELLGWFTAEPLWADLTWVEPGTQLSLQHARFRQCVGTVAAAVHGISKDELDSEEVRQHERGVVVRRALIVGLTVSLMASLVFGTLAQVRGNDAERQGKEASRQRREATMRALLAESRNLLTKDPRTAVRLSLTADRLSPNKDTRAALVNALSTTPYGSGSTGSDRRGLLVRKLNADATVLANAGNGRINLWDVSHPGTRRLLHRMTSPPGDVTDVAFSRGGTLLFAAATKGHELWDISDPKRPRRRAALPGAAGLTAGGFGDHDRRLVTVLEGKDSTGRMDLWDIRAPDLPRRLGSATKLFDTSQVRMSPDGRTVVGATSKVSLSEEDTGRTTVHHTSGMTVWDTTDPARPRRLGRHDIWDGALEFSPDGSTLISGQRRKAFLWRIRPSRTPHLLDTVGGHKGNLRAAAFGPDGRSAATLDDAGVVVRWDLAQPNEPRSQRLSDSELGFGETIAFTAGGGHVLAVDSSDAAVAWNVAARRPLWQRAHVRAAPYGVNTVVVSPDGRTAATGGEHGVLVWDISAPDRPRRLAELRGFTSAVQKIAFSADGRYLAAGDNDSRLIVWDAAKRSSPRRTAVVRTGGSLQSLEFSPRDGLLAGAGGGATLTKSPMEGWATVWTVKGGRAHTLSSYKVKAAAGWVGDGVSFSADGTLLALPGAGTRFVDLTNPTRPVLAAKEPGIDPLAPSAVKFSRKGHLISDGRSIHTVRGRSVGDERVELPDLPRRTGGWAFHPGADLLAMADDSGTAVIWDIGDLSRPAVAARLPQFDDSIDDVAFTEDGDMLLTVGGDGQLRLWGLGDLPAAAASPHRLACDLSGGGLGADEWAKYVPGIPYQRICA
ncbi:TIR domain-containing protein [Streptomyces sp. NPDC048518]|uniref:TIR domain-containing protein n=1 Tax=Streptomyces sp. NPDC048518 TaxID=3155029 RepID=UPI0033E3A76D